jgi:hypothetical protein
MTTAGFTCIDQSSSGASSGNTTILNQSIVDSNGTLQRWCIFVGGTAGTAKLKVFRDDGTNYIFVGESTTKTVALGLNANLVCNITVQTGDILAIYLTGSGIRTKYKSTSSLPWGLISKSGDITTDSLKTTWNTFIPTSGQQHSILATSEIANFYVRASGGNDSNSGDTWANGWATVNKGMVTILSGKTLHVGFGDYLSEPANNTLSPDAADVDVIYETVTTGGGTGSAKVEVN